MASLYAPPLVEVLGTVEATTKASFSNSQKDAVFFAGNQVGTLQGSMDACVSLNPQSPSGTCHFP